MAEFSFDATQVEPQQSFSVVDPGTYNAVALESQMRTTKAGGEMLQYKMQITDGKYVNRVLFARFNVRNDSAEAEKIGRAQLSAFCHAVGVVNLSDTDDLLHKPVRIRVKVRPARDGYDAQNEISGFEAASAQPVARPSVPSSAPSSASRAPSAKPWSKAA
jgi:hypothetical protein